MITSRDEALAVQRAAELERPLQDVEAQLAVLADALCQQDMPAVDAAAAGLHAALAAAIEHFTRAARSGGVPPGLRQRLALAGGQVAAQREALARATAALDRAIDVLIPRHAASANLYSAAGAGERLSGGGAGSVCA